MRHLHARRAARRGRSAATRCAARRRGDQECARRRAVPLHRLSRDPRRGDGRAPFSARDVAELPVGAAVGRRVPRLDGVRKISGAEIFGADEWPADALAARAVRSPHAHAAFVLGDLEAFTRAHPGIVAVFTAKDVPGENCFGVIPPFADQPVLAEERRALSRRGGGACGRRRRDDAPSRSRDVSRDLEPVAGADDARRGAGRRAPNAFTRTALATS